MATLTARNVADACHVDYRKVLPFSQGEYPDFTYDELERLATYLDLRLAPIKRTTKA